MAYLSITYPSEFWPEDERSIGIAFSATAIVGLSTLIGASGIFFLPKEFAEDFGAYNKNGSKRKWAERGNILFAASLGISSGVLLFLALVELFQDATRQWVYATKDESVSYAYNTVVFFAGWYLAVIVNFVIDKMSKCIDRKKGLPVDVPEGKTSDSIEDYTKLKQAGFDTENIENEVQEHEKHLKQKGKQKFQNRMNRIFRTGAMTIVSLLVNNISQGFVNFSAISNNRRLGVSMCLAIAVHNIPAGFSISLPMWLGTGSKSEAIISAGAVGFSSMIGALLAWPVTLAESTILLAVIYSLTSGVMFYVAIHDLYFQALSYDPTDTTTSTAFAFGLLIMAASMVLLHYYGP